MYMYNMVVFVHHVYFIIYPDALKRMLNLNQPLPKAAVATEPVWKVSRQLEFPILPQCFLFSVIYTTLNKQHNVVMCICVVVY